jgi:hypothetical protein
MKNYSNKTLAAFVRQATLRYPAAFFFASAPIAFDATNLAGMLSCCKIFSAVSMAAALSAPFLLPICGSARFTVFLTKFRSVPCFTLNN